MAAKKGRAPVVIEDDFFGEDALRAGEAGARAAREARRDFEHHGGVPNETLKPCEAEGSEGTVLPHCLKVYLPAPAGKFGMVFQLELMGKRAQLRYLAFGDRHHPKGSHAETVYQLAHRRLRAD